MKSSVRMPSHSGRLALVGVLAVLGPPTAARAGIFGVPTGVNYTTGASGGSNPPGWLLAQGVNPQFGDSTGQQRFFIEVTGTTLDILIFDPGLSGGRDINGDGDLRTTYTLYSPSGTVLSTVPNLNNDTAGTQNRLARFTPPCGAAPSSCGFFQLDSGAAGNVSFSGLSPGLYELRVTVPVATDEANGYGLDIRASTNGAHYNVYTIGDTQDPDSGLLVGALNGSSPDAAITQPLTFFTYVDRGCSVQSLNYDMDIDNSVGSGATGGLTDTLGATTGLTMSGEGDGSSGTPAHIEDVGVVEDPTTTNLDSVNYGLYRLSNDIGSQNNSLQWRMADFQGWNDNPANLPRDPVNPIRMYLPNGYTVSGGSLGAVTAPAEPVLGTSTRAVSGANPPTVGMTTRFLITTTASNPTGNTMTGVQVTVGQPAGVTYVAGSQAASIDGSAATCTDSSGGSFRRCTFASLGPGSVASLNVEVDVTPGAPGLLNLTGPPVALPSTSTTSGQYTPAFSSAAFPRTETLGPVCQLVVTVGGAVIPTRATIRGLRVDPAGVVAFATGSQQETAAFNVYAAERGRAPVRLNATPIAAPVPTSNTPILYRVETGPVIASHLIIEEIDTRGRRRLLGPFLSGDRRLRAALERIESRLDEAGAPPGSARMASGLRAARGAPAAASRPRAHGSVRSGGVKIEVAAAGRVRVSFADLGHEGLSQGTPPRRLRLTTQGRAVPFTVEYGDGGRPEVLVFQSETISTAYTGRNVYVLTWGGSPPRMEVPLAYSDDPLPAGFTRAERNTIYVPNAPEDADPWVWDLLFGDGSSWPYGHAPEAGDFDLPGLREGASGPVEVRIRLLGRTADRHTVEAFVNGTPAGALTFDGAVSGVLVGEVPGEVLRRSGNRLSLTYHAGGSGPDATGLVYLGGLDLKVPVVPPSDPVEPVALTAYDPALPAMRGADYLVVTHPAFREQAERVAAYKEAEGHRAVVVDVERAYDRFSAGIVEAGAVRALIRGAARGRRLRFVLLFGDDTFDTRDYAGLGAVSFVPSILGWDGEFGRVPAEGRYADVDDDGRPDLAIGRLPAQTFDEASALADKVGRQAAALRESAGRHTFAVDNQGPGDVDFRALAESVAALLPGGTGVDWADVGQGSAQAHEDLMAAFHRGSEVVHYFGHAGPEVWADEALLTREDVAGLAGSRESVVFTWACESQYYPYLFGSTVNEALVLLPRGGAVASFGPGGITDAALQRALFSRTYRHFLVGRLPLGEAVRRAKGEALLEQPESRPVIEGWNLLGDPALRLESQAAGHRRGR